MKYFVAYLLQGRAYEYHRALTGALAQRFHIKRKASPHLTVKIPFEANKYEIAQLEQLLAQFAACVQPEPFALEGFGRFGFRTIYLDVPKSTGAVALVRDAIEEMKVLPWMQQVPHEGNKLHVSVARFLTYRKFRRIWRTLKSEKPHFREVLDGFVIMKKERPSDSWQLHREFAFGSAFAPSFSSFNVPLYSS